MLLTMLLLSVIINISEVLISEIQKQGEKQMKEEMQMTNNQFIGIIKMIMALIKNDTPKQELLEYLGKLIE